MKKALILALATVSLTVSAPAAAKWQNGGIWAGKCSGVPSWNRFFYMLAC